MTDLPRYLQANRAGRYRYTGRFTILLSLNNLVIVYFYLLFSFRSLSKTPTS